MRNSCNKLVVNGLIIQQREYNYVNNRHTIDLFIFIRLYNIALVKINIKMIDC